MSKNILRFLASLAPAELPKQAASFDLPLTLEALSGSGQIASQRFDDFAVVGELSLEGRTRPVKGALSMAIAAAREKGLKGLVVPADSAPEAAVVEEIVVIPVSERRGTAIQPSIWLAVPRNAAPQRCVHKLHGKRPDKSNLQFHPVGTFCDCSRFDSFIASPP